MTKLDYLMSRSGRREEHCCGGGYNVITCFASDNMTAIYEYGIFNTTHEFSGEEVHENVSSAFAKAVQIEVSLRG